MAHVIGRVLALALATTMSAHATDNCLNKWSWKTNKFTSTDATTNYCSSNDARTCITDGDNQKCDCGGVAGNGVCCKTKDDTCYQKAYEPGTATALSCSTHKVFDDTKKGDECGSSCTFDSTCCKDKTCATHGSVCADGMKLISAAATTNCGASCTFASDCCTNAVCPDFKACEEFASQAACPSYCTWSTSGSRCENGGKTCGNDKMFDDTKTVETFTTDFTTKCCKPITCGNRYLKGANGFDPSYGSCNSGFVYDTATAETACASADDFDTTCCKEQETCGNLKSTTNWACDPASATAPVRNSNQNALVTSQLTFEQNCCTTKAKCSSYNCVTDQPDQYGKVNASITQATFECDAAVCTFNECCEHDDTKCEGKRLKDGTVCTNTNTHFADSAKYGNIISASGNYNDDCCTAKATCQQWADAALITVAQGSVGSHAAPQQTLSVLFAVFGVLVMVNCI